MMPASVPERVSPATLAVSATPSNDWDDFVRSQRGAAVYFQSGWVSLPRDVFGHQTFFIEARDASGRLVGVLPLVRQRSLLGDFATSLPFFNYGGALAPTSEVRNALMSKARDIARDLGCSYLELRDVNPDAENWECRTDKVTMILQLPASMELLGKQLGSKLRSQVKRAEREKTAVRTGGIELLDDFYHVFAHNMRDLGTPVYPKRFFRAILERFPEQTAIIAVDLSGAPSAAGFLVIHEGRAEIPWASCLAAAKSVGLNMKLYWEVLSFAIQRGCTSFDFGRSSKDSGTYRFKKQWGAEPVQLHWHRWDRNPSAQAQPMSESRAMRLATGIWQRLPVGVTNLIGPIISPSLPW